MVGGADVKTIVADDEPAVGPVVKTSVASSSPVFVGKLTSPDAEVAVVSIPAVGLCVVASVSLVDGAELVELDVTTTVVSSFLVVVSGSSDAEDVV